MREDIFKPETESIMSTTRPKLVSKVLLWIINYGCQGCQSQFRKSDPEIWNLQLSSSSPPLPSRQTAPVRFPHYYYITSSSNLHHTFTPTHTLFEQQMLERGRWCVGRAGNEPSRSLKIDLCAGNPIVYLSTCHLGAVHKWCHLFYRLSPLALSIVSA